MNLETIIILQTHFQQQIHIQILGASVVSKLSIDLSSITIGDPKELKIRLQKECIVVDNSENLSCLDELQVYLFTLSDMINIYMYKLSASTFQHK